MRGCNAPVGPLRVSETKAMENKAFVVAAYEPPENISDGAPHIGVRPGQTVQVLHGSSHHGWELVCRHNDRGWCPAVSLHFLRNHDARTTCVLKSFDTAGYAGDSYIPAKEGESVVVLNQPSTKRNGWL